MTSVHNDNRFASYFFCEKIAPHDNHFSRKNNAIVATIVISRKNIILGTLAISMFA